MLKKRYLFSKENFLLSVFCLLIVNLVLVVRTSELYISFFVFSELIKQGINVSSWNSEIIIYLAFFVGVSIFDPLLVTIFNYYSRILKSKASMQFKINLYNSFYSMKTTETKKISKEQLLNMVANDFEKYLDSLVSYVLYFSASVTYVISAIIFVGLINWVLLLSFLSFSLISLVTRYFIQKQSTKLDIKKSRINEEFLIKVNKKFETFIMYINNGYKVPFIGSVLEIIGIRNQKYKTQEDKKVLIGIPSLILNAFTFLSIFGILWGAFNGAPNSEQIAIIAIGLTKYNSFSSAFYQLESSLGFRNRFIQFSKKINESYATFEGKNDVNYKGKISSISFQNVSYSVDQKEIIKNLNLTINKGDKVIISGRSGSGKSTIISMLFNELYPTQGKFLVNNETIKNNISVANNVSFAYNENFIIDGNLNENITLEIDPKIKVKKIDLLKQKLYIDFITDENANINTLDLSEGQKQKIVLARALYQDKEWFILDEATANIDSATKESFEKLLNDLNKTVIFISHTKLETEDKMFNKKLLFDEKTQNWVFI